MYFTEDAMQVVDFTGTRMQPVDHVIHPTTNLGGERQAGAPPPILTEPTAPPPYCEANDSSKYSVPPPFIGEQVSSSGIPRDPPPAYHE